MSLDIDQIAEAFCSYRFVVTYPYMADEIKWTIVGREELMGREAVIDRYQENQTSSVASCDVFQFSDGRLVEITSYVIELNKP
jgi:hypothetical protein